MTSDIDLPGSADDRVFNPLWFWLMGQELTNVLCPFADRRKADKLNLDDQGEWEIKTITSALKNYFR